MDVRYRQYRTGKSQLEFKNSLAFFFSVDQVLPAEYQKGEKERSAHGPWSGARDHK
jgi:hypothetical protein